MATKKIYCVRRHKFEEPRIAFMNRSDAMVIARAMSYVADSDSVDEFVSELDFIDSLGDIQSFVKPRAVME
jgi:hypothetical protein